MEPRYDEPLYNEDRGTTDFAPDENDSRYCENTNKIPWPLVKLRLLCGPLRKVYSQVSI